MSGQASATQRGLSTFCYSASVLHCLPVSKVFKIFSHFYPLFLLRCTPVSISKVMLNKRWRRHRKQLALSSHLQPWRWNICTGISHSWQLFNLKFKMIFPPIMNMEYMNVQRIIVCSPPFALTFKTWFLVVDVHIFTTIIYQKSHCYQKLANLRWWEAKPAFQGCRVWRQMMPWLCSSSTNKKRSSTNLYCVYFVTKISSSIPRIL